MNGEKLVFWTTAIFAVVGAVGMVVSRKAVHSALWVAFTMINLAVLYFSLEAPFLGTTQIVVYTGAIMMLFLFVLMIVGVDSSDSLVETIKGQRLAATLFALGFGGLVIAGVVASTPPPAKTIASIDAGDLGNINGLANLIFGTYLLAFEVTFWRIVNAGLRVKRRRSCSANAHWLAIRHQCQLLVFWLATTQWIHRRSYLMVQHPNSHFLKNFDPLVTSLYLKMSQPSLGR